MFSSIARTVRRLTRPISRPAALFLLWSHRRTLALWFRSVRDEVVYGRQHGGFDAARWQHLLRALWRVSNDSDLVRENELRRLVVTDDDAILADVGEPWPQREDFERAGVEPVSFGETAGQRNANAV